MAIFPTPEPAADQVLVRVGAVAVNPIDTYIRSGAIAMPLAFPFIVGCDLAGTVEKVGSADEAFSTGRPGVGLEPRDARPARNFRRVCRGRRVVGSIRCRRA